MKKFFLLLVLLLTSFLVYCQIPEWEWAVRAGGPASDNVRSMAVDDAGNQYITGEFTNSINFGSINLTSSNPGNLNVYVAKLDSDGNWLWAVRAGGMQGAGGVSVKVDINGFIYVTGYFQGTAIFGNTTLTSIGSQDTFVSRLDVNGNWLWAVRAGGVGSSGSMSMAIDNNGFSVISGWFSGSADFGATNLISMGNNDIFIAKIDMDGDWVWAVRAGGTANDYVSSISVDSTGNEYIAGCFSGSADFGTTNLTSNGDADCFIAKLDSNGNWLWANRVGGTGYDVATAIAVDSVGNAYVTGIFYYTIIFGSTVLNNSSQNTDLFIAKLTPLGDWVWAVQSYGAMVESPNSLTIDISDNVLVTGGFTDIAMFGSTVLSASTYDHYDVFVTKLDTSGNWLWAISAGSSGEDYGNYICADSLGNQYITGLFSNLSFFGTIPLISNGGYDLFVAKLIPEVVSITTSEIPIVKNELKKNYPNPFTSGTTIRYSIKDTSPILIDIYNAKGQHIITLVNEIKSTGGYQTFWNGTNDQGNRVPSGLYIYKMTTLNTTFSQKMILLK
jgi:hypothetical protein